LRDPRVEQDLGGDAAGFHGERDALARERVDEGRRVAEQEIARAPERAPRLPRPRERGEVQREADGTPLEASGREIAGGLRAPAVVAEARLEKAAVRRVAVAY